MSASKDRLLRKQQIEAGTDKRSAAKAKEAAKQRRSNITYAVVGVAVVLFVIFVLFYNSAFMIRHTTAVTIDGQEYSAAQLNYYYSTSYMNFYNSYGNYISYFFNPDESLDDQEYAEGTSWRDYFLDSAVQNMTQVQMLNDQAEEAGFTLSEEQQATFDEQIASLETSWEGLGYTNLQQYLNLNFGKGVDLELVKQEMYRSYVASAFSDSQFDSYEYSDAELDDYYAEHADELDVIHYAYYTLPAAEDTEEPAEEAEEPAEDTEEPAEEAEEPAEEAEEPAEDTEEPAEEAEEPAEETEEPAEEAEEPAEDTEEPAEEAEEPAEEAEEPAEEAEEPAEDTEEPAEEETPEPSEEALAIAEAVDGTDLEAFTDYLADEADGAEPTEQTMPGSSVPTSYAEWLLDSSREPGDATAIATGTSELVVMFLDRDTNDYPTVSFRHILAQAEDTDGDGSFSEEEINAAADEAEGIYDEWQEGDATEDSFAALANERSDDGGSNTTGGLYEEVSKGTMVDPINDWLFDDARKAGDTTVVSYEGDNYTGTHVLYFVGQDDMTYAHAQADTALRSEAYNTWSEEHMANYEATTSHLRLCGKNH